MNWKPTLILGAIGALSLLLAVCGRSGSTDSARSGSASSARGGDTASTSSRNGSARGNGCPGCAASG